MDPKKLSAFVENQSGPAMGDLEMGGQGPSDEESQPEDLLGRGEELLVSLGEFGEELSESADLMVSNAMDIGEGLLEEELDEDTLDMVEEMGEAMPSFIQEGMAELAEKSREDLDAIGAALDAKVDLDSPVGEYTPKMASKIGGMLKACAKYCKELDGVEELGEDLAEADPEEYDDLEG